MPPEVGVKLISRIYGATLYVVQDVDLDSALCVCLNNGCSAPNLIQQNLVQLIGKKVRSKLPEITSFTVPMHYDVTAGSISHWNSLVYVSRVDLAGWPTMTMTCYLHYNVGSIITTADFDVAGNNTNIDGTNHNLLCKCTQNSVRAQNHLFRKLLLSVRKQVENNSFLVKSAINQLERFNSRCTGASLLKIIYDIKLPSFLPPNGDDIFVTLSNLRSNYEELLKLFGALIEFRVESDIVPTPSSHVPSTTLVTDVATTTVVSVVPDGSLFSLPPVVKETVILSSLYLILIVIFTASVCLVTKHIKKKKAVKMNTRQLR